MLPKKRRIPRQEFGDILARGRRFNSPSILLYVAEIGGATPSRFAFSVSKKVCKGAVDRNTFRRRGYSVVRDVLEKVKPGFFCFFSFKKGSSSLTFEKMQTEIIDLLHSSGVIS